MAKLQAHGAADWLMKGITWRGRPKIPGVVKGHKERRLTNYLGCGDETTALGRCGNRRPEVPPSRNDSPQTRCFSITEQHIWLLNDFDCSIRAYLLNPEPTGSWHRSVSWALIVPKDINLIPGQISTVLTNVTPSGVVVSNSYNCSERIGIPTSCRTFIDGCARRHCATVSAVRAGAIVKGDWPVDNI